jgi:NAD(P)-dependent dehydrogenase (short-subunit alcohol dehydrogenase family)
MMRVFPDRGPFLIKFDETVISAASWRRAEIALDYAARIMRTNYEGPALILSLIADRFLARGHGSLVGVSSVAGDRGRGSNYFQGSAKAGFSVFLSGLRNRLAIRGSVHVMTVRPGFV